MDMSLFSKSRESSTLQLVIPAVGLLFYKFAVGGTVLFGISNPYMTGTEFSLAFAAVMAVWLQREWRSAKFAANKPDEK